MAVRCLGELLTTHSHFNFTSNIIQALVPLLNHPHDDLSDLTASYLTKLFKGDKGGYLSYEVRPEEGVCVGVTDAFVFWGYEFVLIWVEM